MLSSGHGAVPQVYPSWDGVMDDELFCMPGLIKGSGGLGRLLQRRDSLGEGAQGKMTWLCDNVSVAKDDR